LATELSAAQKDSSLPPLLALDRVWIVGDGRAKLLDFPVPGIPASSADAASPPIPSNMDAPRFLGQIAAAALEGRADSAAKPASEVSIPLPLHVRQFFRLLPQLLDADAFLLALQPLLQRVAVVTRQRRAAMVAACILFPFLLAGGALLYPSSVEDVDSLGFFELVQLLHERSTMRHSATNQLGPTDRQYAVYIASHYREIISDKGIWSSRFAHDVATENGHRFAQESLTQKPAPTANEIAEADAAIKKLRPRPDMIARLWRPSLGLMVLSGLLAFCIFPLTLVAALAFRGGLALLVTDVTFVRRDGAPASRLRLLWRAFVAWIPVCLAMVLSTALLFTVSTVEQIPRREALALVLLAGLALISVGLPLLSIALPQRGLQDRLAGTWPVLR
jgi:hypothetical protein